MKDHEERISALEKKLFELEGKNLELRANLTYQGVANEVLLALIEEASNVLSRGVTVAPGKIREMYLQQLKSYTHRYLAQLADGDPALASKLRSILSSALDAS